MRTIAATSTRPRARSAITVGTWPRIVARRVLGACAALLAASVLIFAGLTLLPGSTASVVLGRNATPQAVKILTARMDLNRPAVVRYFDWLGGFVHGDLGQSSVALAQGAKTAPIWPEISGPLENSAVLALLAAAFMIPLSLGLGVLAAIRAGKPVDHGVSLGSLVAISLPEFVTGSLLVAAFFAWLHLLPPVALVPPGTSPLAKPDALILPVVTLLLASLAGGIRMVRSGMLEVLQADYVQAARLNGLPERRVLVRYALRNALAPSVQILAQNLQYLVGGIVVVEAVFGYPGIGTLLVNAVQNRDITVVQSVAMLIAVVYVLINLVADLVVIALVPKLRDAK
jgi:peptide/nickel transport system permease protein